MARTFGNSRLNWLESASFPTLTLPASLSVWHRNATSGAEKEWIYSHAPGTNSNPRFAVSIEISGSDVRQALYSGSYSYGSTWTPDTEWEHLGWVWEVDGSVSFYRNGAANGTATRSAGGSHNGSTSAIGSLHGAVNNFDIDGALYGLALWGQRKLELEHFVALNAGRSPLLIYRSDLLRYVRLDGGTGGAADLIAGEMFTERGTVGEEESPIWAGVDLVSMGAVAEDSSGVSITSPANNFSFQSFAPAVGSGAAVESPLSSFTFQAFAPIVGGGVSIPAPLASFPFQGFAPSVDTGANIAAPVVQFTFQAFPPSVGAGVTVAAPLDIFTFQAFAPSLQLTSVSINAPLEGFTFQLHAPSIGTGVAVEVPFLDFTFQAFSPGVGAGASVQVPLETFNFQALAPSVATAVLVLDAPLATFSFQIQAPFVVTTTVPVQVGVSKTLEDDAHDMLLADGETVFFSDNHQGGPPQFATVQFTDLAADGGFVSQPRCWIANQDMPGWLLQGDAMTRSQTGTKYEISAIRPDGHHITSLILRDPLRTIPDTGEDS